MQTGLVFSVEEFSTFNGPGIRATVFLKGCPLRCAATEYTVDGLCERLTPLIPMLRPDGGVTFSGGEPLAQPDFLLGCLRKLRGQTHRALQTAGYAAQDVFRAVLRETDYVLFDQYMLPYFLADRARGVSDAELFETLELFFISLNADIDLYWGMQRGDDGQSMMLGGYGADGEDMFNPLSAMCIRASEELCLIDPKINLRVNRTTPIERYELGTELTRKGLGFPQYCNDDGVPKVARLVQCFIERGGHQLQLNAVNRDVLLAAKAHPEEYRNLIVRVWGWSGYFTELDPWFQEHIIVRTEFTC